MATSASDFYSDSVPGSESTAPKVLQTPHAVAVVAAPNEMILVTLGGVSCLCCLLSEMFNCAVNKQPAACLRTGVNIFRDYMFKSSVQL